MATKRKSAKRQGTKKAVELLQPEPEIKRVEVRGDLETMRGRFANHIQIAMKEEEFILDFFANSEQGCHVGRIFITPQHAKRLADLLKKQIKVHMKRFKSSPLAVRTAKRKTP